MPFLTCLTSQQVSEYLSTILHFLKDHVQCKRGNISINKWLHNRHYTKHIVWVQTVTKRGWHNQRQSRLSFIKTFLQVYSSWSHSSYCVYKVGQLVIARSPTRVYQKAVHRRIVQWQHDNTITSTIWGKVIQQIIQKLSSIIQLLERRSW